jgi:hypothetical protein
MLLGAAVGSGVYWKYSGPPSTELRWSNTIQVAPKPEKAFEEHEASYEAWEKPTVSVYSAPYAAPRAAPVTLKDLSADGQAHAIDFLLKPSMQPEAARQKLMSLLGDDAGARDRGDPYRADRVLVATVDKGLNALPGDRLLWTRILVEPINFRFAGYTVAATDNKSIKLTSIESSTSTKLSIKNSSGTDVPGLGKPEVGQEVGKTQKATSDVNQQYENLGIDIRPTFLRIIRESAPGGDVAGNTTVQLSMLTDPSIVWCERAEQAKEGSCPPRPVSKVPRSESDETDSSENLVLIVSSAHLADGEQEPRIDVLPQSALPHCSLKANVSMLYEVRHITSGRENLIEGLQQVELKQDASASAQAVPIVPADDIAPAVWSIKVTDEKTRHPATDGALDLKARIDNGSARKLVFTDYLIASELTHWLKTQLAAGTGAQPRLNKMTFMVDANNTLTPFKHVADDCEPKREMTPGN